MNCTSCGNPLGSTPAHRRKTSFCRKCAARATANSPEKQEKCREAMLQTHQNRPELRGIHADAMKAIWQQRQADPVFMARASQNGMILNRPDVRAKAVAASIESRMAWCPPEYRDEYKFLQRQHSMRASEAREAIRSQITADIARANNRFDCPHAIFLKARAAQRWLRTHVSQGK